MYYTGRNTLGIHMHSHGSMPHVNQNAKKINSHRRSAIITFSLCAYKMLHSLCHNLTRWMQACQAGTQAGYNICKQKPIVYIIFMCICKGQTHHTICPYNMIICECMISLWFHWLWPRQHTHGLPVESNNRLEHNRIRMENAKYFSVLFVSIGR